MQDHHQPEFVRALIMKAVRRYIADAIRSRSLVSASDCAAEILATYPACQLDQAAVADEVILAAARAGVPVQTGPSGRETTRVPH
jgi:hypothetical protein